MAFLGSMFDPSKGAGWQAQGLQQPLQSPNFQGVDLNSQLEKYTNPNQIAGANQAYQNSLGATGAANQQAQGGIGQQQAFLSALQGQGGIGNQANVYNQQQNLANQLQGVASGTGPNPAQAMLANTTGANVANQAALMAGQRGTGANSGLLAREAAQQGAATQQQAAGQGASMQAQQQMNALGQLQGQQAQMAQLAGSQVGQQGQALGQLNTLNQAQQQQALQQQQAAQAQQALLLGQGNTQNSQAQTQQQLQSQQQQALNQNASSMAQNINSVNQAMQGNLNTTQGQIAQGNQKSQAGLVGGVLGGVGSLLGLAEGGEVPDAKKPRSFIGRYASGGGIGQSFSDAMSSDDPISAGAKSLVSGIGRAAMGGMGSTPMADLAMSHLASQSSLLGGNPIAAPSLLGGAGGPAAPSLMGGATLSGGAPAALSGITPMLLAGGGHVIGEQLAAQGKMVPGQAKVKGDSEKNDIVDAKLSPGEIVIPRSIAQGKNPARESAKFVKAVIERKHRKNG